MFVRHKLVFVTAGPVKYLGGVGFHQNGFSSNAQFNIVFKTVSRISVALQHQKLLMILWE